MLPGGFMGKQTHLILFLVLIISVGNGLCQTTPRDPFRRDTLFTHSGKVIVGEIVEVNEIQIVIKPNKFGSRLATIRFSQIESLSTRPWTIVLLDGSIIEAEVVETIVNPRALRVRSHGQDSISFDDIGGIYNLQVSILARNVGASLGSFAGFLPVAVVTFAGENAFPKRDRVLSTLWSAFPFASIGGIIIGSKLQNQKLELASLYVCQTLVETDNYQQGWHDGRRSPAGNGGWLFTGLGLNIFALEGAGKYRPVPTLNTIPRKSGAYIVGYIEGYGDAGRAANLSLSILGAVGNGFIVASTVLLYAIPNDPNFTN
jgi:hypothetical protein